MDIISAVSVRKHLPLQSRGHAFRAIINHQQHTALLLTRFWINEALKSLPLGLVVANLQSSFLHLQVKTFYVLFFRGPTYVTSVPSPADALRRPIE